MYTNRVFGIAKCVLFIKVSSFQGFLNGIQLYVCIMYNYYSSIDILFGSGAVLRKYWKRLTFAGVARERLVA